MNSGENMSYFYPVLRENYGTFFLKSRIKGFFPYYGTSKDHVIELKLKNLYYSKSGRDYR